VAEWLWRVTQDFAGNSHSMSVTAIFMHELHEHSRRETCRGSNPLLLKGLAFAHNMFFLLVKDSVEYLTLLGQATSSTELSNYGVSGSYPCCFPCPFSPRSEKPELR
jgi:hypothetical protein